MKDFLKIFVTLCLVVAAFFWGRSYGEKSVIENEDFKKIKSENFQNKNAQEELINLKEKFQNLLDSSDLKKTDELLGKIMTIFLADLGLRLSNDQQKDFSSSKNNFHEQQKSVAIEEEKKLNSEEEIEKSTEPVKNNLQIKNENKFKSNEWILENLEDTEEIKNTLKKLEVKRIDSLTIGSSDSTFEQSKKFFGSYKGTIFDVDNQVYGTMTMDIFATPAGKNSMHGKIKVYRDGEERISSEFDRNSIGYSPENFKATIITAGASNYFQVYKIENTNKIAGIFYERLPKGTSKTIGRFVLSRVDFED